MALGVVAIVVLSYLTLNRPPPPRFSAPDPAAGTSSPAAPETPATVTQPAEPVRVLVVGDDYSTPPAGGGGWPELVAGDLGAAGRPAELVLAASDQAGYAEPDATGSTFVTLAQRAGSDFDLVVFFGSRYDIAAADDVRTAATAAFTAAQAASPDAVLVVIGPAWPAVPPPGYIITNRDAVAAAAGAAGAVFVDPLVAGWFTAGSGALVTPDGGQVTAEGQRYLADLIGPVVEPALPRSG